MWIYCWPTIADADPTLTQHWVNVLCLLVVLLALYHPQHIRVLGDINFGLMLGHRLLRWSSIKPTLAQCLVFARISLSH